MMKKLIYILPLLFLSLTRESLGNDLKSYFVNHAPVDFSLTQQKEAEFNSLLASFTNESPSADQQECFYRIKEIVEGGKTLILEDGSIWLVGLFYRDIVRDWQPGQRLRLAYHSQHSNNIQFENVDQGNCAWGVNEKMPEKALGSFILRVSNSAFESSNESKLIMDNGLIFKGPRVTWKVREQVFIFHSPSYGYYEIWNQTRKEWSSFWKLVGNEKEGSSESFFNIEDQLNKQVLGQKEVVKCVSSALFNCWAGLNDPKLPIGVFLFLGPTGVGKTELAKTLTQELYKNPQHLIRFDMSQFVTQYDYTRLIGSPPGYVNHEEGGQLTNALKAHPASIVLLDEIEKAHPGIHKAFLPIFDEGYITDSKNKVTPCNRAIFIMTGNICSEKIAHLFHRGYSSEEVLKAIEPEVIAQLSPELYNRLTTVVFRPITPELMASLVDQKLEQVIQQLKKTKKLELIIDDSVKQYLITHGYHPTLGVRPLKRLIQNELISFVSYAIIKDGIPENSILTLWYLEHNDSWHLSWSAD